MRAITVSLAFVVSVSAAALGQDRSADEKAIRDIVAQSDTKPQALELHQPDSVFWSGAYVKPVVGNEKPQARPGSSAGGGRTNATTQTRIQQLHVAAGGDMAYEYSTFKQSWVRTDNKQNVALEGAILRTWRKVDGRWKVGAEFRRPYDDSATTR